MSLIFSTNSYESKNNKSEKILFKKKVELAENLMDREKFDILGDLYSIINAVEHLEKSFVRDAIKSDE
jgi:hypothetical protein